MPLTFHKRLARTLWIPSKISRSFDLNFILHLKTHWKIPKFHLELIWISLNFHLKIKGVIHLKIEGHMDEKTMFYAYNKSVPWKFLLNSIPIFSMFHSWNHNRLHYITKKKSTWYWCNSLSLPTWNKDGTSQETQEI